MQFREILNQVTSTLVNLDNNKKIALATAFVVTLAAVIFISFQVSKPATSPLYSNLSREDLNNMSRLLSENGIEFVISQEQNSIGVPTPLTAHARMLLAEHGLPSTEKSGYQLFDKVNTLGLTSFMQNITNKRAIEGELVRTIQMINGVNSARVHLVIEERNVFRRGPEANSSASVVLKTYGKLPARSINAVRHMVAAAVPGLTASNVTIVGSDGSLLTTKDDVIGGSTKLVELEREYERDVEEKILLALGAHLGAENLRVSASVKLNSDKRRVDEVIYDPESRIERSVQIVREAGTTENKEAANPVTIDQNLPEAEVAGGSGQLSSENNERREELTNYEINEKKISLVSDGYIVEAMTVAVLVNKTRIEQIIGTDADQTTLDAKVEELQQIVSSAVSAAGERGDKVTVKLVEFMPSETQELTDSSGGWIGFLALHLGSILNSLGMIAAAVLFAVLGIRPVLAFLNRAPATPAANPAMLENSMPSMEALGGPDNLDAFAPGDVSGEFPDDVGAGFDLPGGIGEGPALDGGMGGVGGEAAPDEVGDEMAQVMRQETRLRKQLEQMVDQSEQRSAIAIRHWLQQDGASAI